VTLAGAGTLRGRSASAAWPALAFGVLFVGAWQGLVVLLDIQPYLLPSPAAIAVAFAGHAGTLVSATLTTGGNALLGFLVGALVAVIVAALAAALPVVDRMLAPLVAAVAVLPIVSIAPVLYTMYGADTQTPRQTVAAIAVFAPVFLNTVRGLRRVAPVHRDLMRSYAAGGWDRTRYVTLPGALPSLFGGLNVASSLAVISALVAEYFGGPQNGLGALITSSAANSAYDVAWAYVIGAIVLGLVFFVATLLLERAVTRRR
jgi:NitT/TauT family transport system permease protein